MLFYTKGILTHKWGNYLKFMGSFLGYGIIILAHGLQGNLLGLRAVLENFEIVATGILMSEYFIGYF